MSAKTIDNPLYQGMSLKSLLETTDLFQIPGLLDENGAKKDVPIKKDGSDSYKPTAAFLGPDLWDNTQKMSLEYMDLDEFLNENNIPLELCMSPGSSETEQRISTPPGSPTRISGMLLGGDASPLRPATVVSTEEFPPQLSLGRESPMQFINPIMIGQRAMSPDSDSPPSECSTVSPIRTENRNFVIKVSSRPNVSASSISNTLTNNKIVNVDFHLDESELALATVPGIDFDPRERAFTDDELKPQPMIKKSRKQYVPEDLKDDHYWQRRNKNNVAAKRSREARRTKENQIAMRANFLEKENRALTIELAKSKTELNLLKKRLTMFEK
ncbi:unnamed protein product [Meganyctiphanes norvegica]|uniref:BZIP domain-containing protein n=1 Tax=Meganyctiphanes norvegica TaxID=48144 RepID=A0AAV2QW00_MEGNR